MTMRRIVRRRSVGWLTFAVLFVFLACAASASAATVGWAVHTLAEPSVFASSDEALCKAETKCDQYQILVENDGSSRATTETITLTDQLPPGITTFRSPRSGQIGPEDEEREWECSGGAGQTTVTCTLEVTEVLPGHYLPEVLPGHFLPLLTIIVHAPAAGVTESLSNEVTVAGGGAEQPVVSKLETPANQAAPPFEINEFAFDPTEPGGASSLDAGAHPWQITADLGVPSRLTPQGAVTQSGSGKKYVPSATVSSASVELPLGVVGNPQAVMKQCTEVELETNHCPQESEVGTYAFAGDLFNSGAFAFSGDESISPDFYECCSDIYELVPEAGYPAEFGFTYAYTIPIHLYATVVHGAGGYRLRVVAPGIPAVAELSNSVITFWGDPGAFNGSGSKQAFLTNPAQCATGELSSRAELASASDPGNPVSKETEAYSRLTGCEALRFHPSLTFEPSSSGEGGTSVADEPSAFTADLKVPQTTGFEEAATPELRSATVTLPAGLSINPAAGQGLEGCEETGPRGINIGTSNPEELGPRGEDLEDPEASELGAGHPGGDGSPYDDGFYHTAPGHCPAASTVGTAEVFTPLLANGPNGEAPLTGRVYVAEPKCGGEGQAACTEASATNGELFGAYLEVEGHGVILKLKGSLSANPQTGQITATFTENPQLPFSELKLHINGGPRAPFANPQTCGAASTSSLLEPWSGAGETASVSGSYAVSGCAASMPFSPSFSAGTTSTTAGASTPFTLSFSRQDREQDLSGLSVTLPPGLIGKIAGVPLCGEPQANAGTCGAESESGTTTVTAGAGSNPLPVTGGRVYLTTGYKGAPFGLSVVVPAVAGPFNLGNVVVRAAISINPDTAQVTVTSDPLPQIKDGVPFRLRSVNVEINRSAFTFNPTNCSAQHVTGTLTAAQGASVGVSSPFAAVGCQGLKFKPALSATTQAGGTTRGNGASLDVQLQAKQGPGFKAGEEEANIAKVDVSLPYALSSRLTTLQKACGEAQFAANPAGCPKESNVGTATVHTPILSNPLTGPAYLVSHGGEAFPDLDLVLQGEGVEVVLTGHTQIKSGITYSHFETVPDAPISSFNLELPEKPFSILGAIENLCDTNLQMPTEITGQNGAVEKGSTRISTEGCASSLAVASSKVKKRTLTLSVYAPGAGKVTTSGKGVSNGIKTYSGREALTFKIKQKKAGKLKTKIKLTYTPSSGKRQTKTLSVKFKQ
jgi:hypothetical protein